MASNSQVKSLYGRHAALVSGHHLASRAADEALKAGGSLIDAMIAASAMLGVALPHTSSLGGCAMMLYFDAASGKVHALNGSGRAPLAAEPALFPDGLPQRGSRSWLTPTLVRFWARAHERFGRLPWHSLFEPAIAGAREGLGCSEELGRNLRLAGDQVLHQPGFRQAFGASGGLLGSGELFVQPCMARVLEEVARQGEPGFYQGWVAASMLEFSRSTGGLLTAEDLAQTQADWVDALAHDANGACVHVMPPNSSGWLMLEQLANRTTLPDPVSRISQDILMAIDIIARKNDAPARAGAAASSVSHGDGGSAYPVRRPHSCEPGDTTGFVGVDAGGNAVSMLQSVFQPFGSGCVDPGTGVLFNNRMYDFSLDPGSANCLEPRKRPVHTLNPYLVLKRGAAYVAGASPGGVSQTTTGFQILRELLDGPSSLAAAVRRPRWSLGRDGTVLLEEGIAQGVAQQLRAQGLNVIENSNHEFYFGSVKVVRVHDEACMREAAADARREAYAIAW